MKLRYWKWAGPGMEYTDELRPYQRFPAGSYLAPCVDLNYEIPVDQINASDRGLVDWMFQLKTKTWMTPEMFFEFATILNETHLARRGPVRND